MKVKFTFKKAKGNLKHDILILGEKYLNSYLTKVEDAD